MKLKYFLLLPLTTAWACTDILIDTEDDTFLNGRSMEFATPMHTKITLHPKGEASKYGYVALSCFDEGLTTDGMNEAGLSVGALWFVGAQYPQFNPKHPNSIVLQDLGDWLLGNFATVEEAKVELPKIAVWAEPVSSIGIPPIHIVLHDATGKSLVLEFINGKMEISENPGGVMTNAPELQWHLTNLRNYIHLSPLNADSITINSLDLQPTGQGTGLLGLPGDWSSPSRFVRASFFKAFASVPKTALAGVNLLEHLLNTVDIPLGTIRANPKSHYDLTQWIVIKDMTHKVLYYRTYENLTLRCIDLKKLDFSKQNKVHSFPMDAPAAPVDMTTKFQ
jgi:choloylglycine hydrolase